MNQTIPESERFYFPDWYQVDFRAFYYEDIGQTARSVFNLIGSLKEKQLFTRWFFLYEGPTIRVRFETKDPLRLEALINRETIETNLRTDEEWKFEQYWEENWKFNCIETIEVFVAIMHQISELEVKKDSGLVKFDNYRFLERIQHCLHNNIYGTNTEEAFLAKRLAERLSNTDTTSSILDFYPKPKIEEMIMEGR